MFRPTHFDFAAADPDRSAAFYRAVLGWRFEKWGGPMEYWLITTGREDHPGINGGMSRKGPNSTGGTVITADVSDVEAVAKAVEKNGGKVAMPKMPVPGVGWLIYFTDPEGTLMGAMQRDPDAK
ncbi:MAG: VOC family protein [Hyphomicrobiales bacterium]